MSERLLVRVVDGITFRADSDYITFTGIWNRALARHEWIEMVNDAGLRRLVNPHQIIYVAEPDDVQAGAEDPVQPAEGKAV
jgi:hypothetical protein